MRDGAITPPHSTKLTAVAPSSYHHHSKSPRKIDINDRNSIRTGNHTRSASNTGCAFKAGRPDGRQGQQPVGRASGWPTVDRHGRQGPPGRSGRHRDRQLGSGPAARQGPLGRQEPPSSFTNSTQLHNQLQPAPQPAPHRLFTASSPALHRLFTGSQRPGGPVL